MTAPGVPHTNAVSPDVAHFSLALPPPFTETESYKRFVKTSFLTAAFAGCRYPNSEIIFHNTVLNSFFIDLLAQTETKRSSTQNRTALSNGVRVACNETKTRTFILSVDHEFKQAFSALQTNFVVVLVKLSTLSS